MQTLPRVCRCATTPLDNLHSMSSHWPFTMWGMDILGKLPKVPRAVKYLLVAIEYFTKYIKARPCWEIIASEVEKFTSKHLLCTYNLPHTIVIDNNTQFNENPYRHTYGIGAMIPIEFGEPSTRRLLFQQ